MVLIPSVVLRFYGALSLGFGMIGTCGEITPLLDDQWIEKNRLGGFIVKRKDVLSTGGKSGRCGTSSSSNSEDDLGLTSTSLLT